MSLLNKLMGTRSCASLPPVAQITTLVAVKVLPSFACVCNKEECEMLPKQANATSCNF